MDKDTLTITHHETRKGGEYRAQLAGRDATALLQWTHGEPVDGRAVRIGAYTFVPPAFRGAGAAAQLTRAFVADARRGGYLIVPQCSYIAAKFDENPDWAVVRA